MSCVGCGQLFCLSPRQRAFEQSWALLSCYLTQPQSVREDLLWAARTVTEKVKTDQRSRALEVLCVGVFGRGAAAWPGCALLLP